MNADAPFAEMMNHRYLAAFLSVALALSFSLGVAHAQDPIPVSLPDSSGFDVGETIQVPIYVDADLPDGEIFSADVAISYDPSVVTFTGEFTAEGTISEQFPNLNVNVPEPGTIEISAAAGQAISGDAGTFILLEAETQSGGTSPLDFVEFQFNEGDPATSTTDGSLTVGEGTTEQATVNLENQTTSGTEIVVESVSIPRDGYIAIHDSTLLPENGGDALGSVIGVSGYLEAGTHTDVDVYLFDPPGQVPGLDTSAVRILDDQTLIAMPHEETSGNMEYNFLSSEGSEDGPYTNDAGEAVIDPADITVESAEVTFNDQMSEDNQTVTVASASIADPGYVAIHDSTLLGPDGVPFTDDDQPLESVIGVSEFLEPGEYTDLQVTLFDVPGKDFPADTTLPVDQTLIAMPHMETNGNQTYNFITAGGMADIPFFDENQHPVVDLGFVEVMEGSGATVTFDDQMSEDGQTVTVASTTLPEDGYVAIHDSTLLGPDGVPFTDDDQPLESVIGVSEHLDAGSYENLDVTLFEVVGKSFPADTTLPVDQTLIAMPHQETNGNIEYNFITSGGEEDIPYFNDEGNPVVDPGFVDVPGDEGSGATVTFDDQMSEDGQTVTVASVTLPEDGYVAIHDSTLLGPDGVPFTDDDQPLASVIGVSDFREPGTYEDFDVTLFDVPGKSFPADTTLPVDQTLIAMPHEETNGNQEYNFITSGGTEDIPYFNDAGNPVVDPGFVDVVIGPLVINEVHADPASGEDGDANGDGTRDAEDDEFVEIANVGDSPIDISNYTLSDEVEVRHTFPEGTVLDPGVGVVVFGGGDPASFPGVTQTASSGSLSLNNTGDMVLLESDDGTQVASMGYGTEGPAPSPEGESLARNPDFSGTFVPHTDIGTDRDGDGMADLYSPGYENVDSSPLPVEVVGFSAQAEDHDVRMTWKTLSETNNAGFFVQYQRKDQGDWTTANAQQIIEGAGTSLEEQSYSFKVSDLRPGAYTFRLQQKDYDSPPQVVQGVVAEATVEPADRYELSPASPNPFRSRAEFRLDVQKEQNVTVELYNTLGQRVERVYSGSVRPGSGRIFTIDGGQLASGVYFYRVHGENFSTARRVVLVK